jgi:predicted nucleic acid-binding Zn ribbon protein
VKAETKKQENNKQCPAKQKKQDILQGNRKRSRKKNVRHRFFFFITELLVEMLFAKAFIKIENFHRMAK